MGWWATIRGGQPKAGATGQKGIPLLVDPTFGAARVSVRPDEYAFGGRVLGHYAVAIQSGLYTASIVGGVVIYAMRWAEPTALFVLKRLRLSAGITTAFTGTALPIETDLWIQRAWTVAPSGGTPFNVGLSGRQRGTMAPSLATVYAATTGAVTPLGTSTGDNITTACAALPIATGTVAAGVACAPVELYSSYSQGQHPLIFAAQEGFVVRNLNQLASTAGALHWNFHMEWMEVAGY